MTAEEYVMRVKMIDDEITDALKDHARWVEVAEGLGGDSVSERVQSSRNLQKSATAIGNYIDIESEILLLKQERQEIINTIRQLRYFEYKVIVMFYLQDKTHKEIAYHFKKSYDWSKTTKRKALRHLQEIIDKKGANH